MTGPDGSTRTVTPAEFAHWYQLIAGERYRWLGSVRARRAVAVKVIVTLEGAATARPGDWVVTGPNGNSWPVPDEVFRAGYAAGTGGRPGLRRSLRSRHADEAAEPTRPGVPVIPRRAFRVGSPYSTGLTWATSPALVIRYLPGGRLAIPASSNSSIARSIGRAPYSRE